MPLWLFFMLIGLWVLGILSPIVGYFYNRLYIRKEQ